MNPSPTILAATEPDGAVDAGRDALEAWYGSRYPWYDAQSDSVGRIELRRPYDWDWVPDWSFDLSGLLPQSFFAWVIWIAAILLLVALIFLLIRMRLIGKAPETESETNNGTPAEDDVGRVEALPFRLEGGRLDLLGEVRRHYLADDYRQAVVYLFSFQLLELDKHHLIRLTKGKTNRQYLLELGSSGPLRRMLEQTMVAFEDVFFGNHDLEQGRFESCWTHLEEFRSLAALGAG